MKIYTRLLTLVLCLCLLATAIGCGKEPATSDPESTVPTETQAESSLPEDPDAEPTTSETEPTASSDVSDTTTTQKGKVTTKATAAKTTSAGGGWGSDTDQSAKKMFDKRGNIVLKNKKKDSDPDVVLFIPWDTSADESFKAVKAGFEKDYGVKVKVITGEWGTRDIKLTQLIHAGSSPDYVPTGVFDFPRRAIKGTLQPLDSLIQDCAVLDTYVMNNLTSWEGKRYAIIGKRAPGVLYYNTTMLKNAMITDTPTKLAKENKWTWQDLKDMARKLTQDTNKDGKPDIYGFGTELDFIFPLSAGTDIVKINNGKPTLNIDDETWRKALLFYYDGVNKDKIFTPTRWSVWEEFANGNVAMYYGTSGEAEKIVNKGMKNWDIAPFPKANASDANYVGYNNSDGFGIANGAKNPVGGVAFGEYQYNYYIKKNKENPGPSLFTEEQNKMMDSLENRVTLLYGYGMEDSFCQAFGNYMRKNGDFTALMEEMRPIWQKNLDETLKGR